MSQGMKLSLLVALVLAAIIVPFMIWGEALDSLAPQMLQRQDARWYIAVLGAALLMVDVLLPVPSSIVSALLCVLLGPLHGSLAIMVGMMAGFACGYLLGRMLPADTLRRWVGAALWDSVRDKAARQSTAWIVVSRPVPVLAEAVSILAGSLRVRWQSAMLAAALSSAVVASCFGATAAVGLTNGSFWLSFGASVALASAAWFVSSYWRARI